MSLTIRRGATVLSPVLALDGYESSRPTGTQAHEVIGADDPDITFGIAGTRRGTLRLFFLDESSARACELEHLKPGTLTYADSEVASVAMTYVPVDDVTTRLDPTSGRWIVTVPFRELTS